MEADQDLIIGVILTIIGLIITSIVIAILVGGITGDFQNDAWWWWLILLIGLLIGIGGIYLWDRSRRKIVISL